MNNSDLKFVFGAMTFGKPDTLGARVHIQEAAEMLNVFQSHGHNEVDTARIYGAGSSEEALAAAEWQKRGLAMATNLYPSTAAVAVSYTHQPEDLSTLSAERIDLFYLHGPDRKTPVDTLREVNRRRTMGLWN